MTHPIDRANSADVFQLTHMSRAQRMTVTEFPATAHGHTGKTGGVNAPPPSAPPVAVTGLRARLNAEEMRRRDRHVVWRAMVAAFALLWVCVIGAAWAIF